MTFTQSWHIYAKLWEIPLTMVLGSFVAGCTPTGGSAVAFPVFTKLFDITPDDARTFGLMIQSIGMTSASLFIWHSRIPVLWNVVLYTSIGGVLGTLLSGLLIYPSAPYPKLLFTTMITIFAVALIFNHLSSNSSQNKEISKFGNLQRIEFIIVGVVGGIISNTVGSGTDIIVYMTLALCYRICEKVSIPTTVICMAINSVIGFLVHASIDNDIKNVWEYWIISCPVVAIGAPLGALQMTYWSRNQILAIIIILITVDLVSSLIVLNLTHAVWYNLAIFLVLCMIIFSVMIRRGNKMFSANPISQNPAEG
jgi:uncharacterized membrane protein YfcA